LSKKPLLSHPQLGASHCHEAGKPFVHEVIGTFPGEKLHEILITEEEIHVPEI